jgi:hypothetical protein
MLSPSTATLGDLGGETKSKLLYEIVADTAASSQDCPLAQTHAYRRASQGAPLSMRAVAATKRRATSISQPFMRILSAHRRRMVINTSRLANRVPL